MKLNRLTVKNFKSIPPAGVSVEFRDRFVALVGKNNAGKSNIIEAIGMLFGSKNPRYLPIPSEFFHDPSRPLSIEAEFSGATYGDGKSVGLSDAQCHALTPKDKQGQPKPGNGAILLKLDVPAAGGDGGKGGNDDEDDDEAKQTFTIIVGEKSEIKRNEAIRKAVVKHILVPPLRDEDKLLSPSTWTAYGRMLRDILADSDQAAALTKMIADTSAKMQALLQDEADTLSAAAQCTAYVDEVAFRFTKDGNPTELLRNLSLAVTFAGRTDDISAVGTGTQSAVIIGVLELCLRHKARRGVRFFVIEEPELFLHPHAQRYVARLLRRISEEEKSYVLITTHSPSVLADTDLLDVIRVDRDASGATGCRRVPAEFPGLAKAERILTAETCEMMFADRVVLVEGPSESKLLPRLSTLPAAGGSGIHRDFDGLNVSVTNVGGKEHFAPFTDVLDHFGVSWRIVADADAIDGSALQSYFERAGIESLTTPDEKRRKLREAGIAVLSKGEIEDYYPHAAVASIAGCAPAEVAEKIVAHRASYDDPSAAQIVEAVVTDHHDSIKSAAAERIPKLVNAWYSQSLQRLRDGGALKQSQRKTGDALGAWLRLGKPIIASKVASWICDHPTELPQELRNLLDWVSAGLAAKPAKDGNKA